MHMDRFKLFKKNRHFNLLTNILTSIFTQIKNIFIII